jgi:hypothetical protein
MILKDGVRKDDCGKFIFDKKVDLDTDIIELTKDITKRELTATTRITSEYQPHITMILPKWSEFKNA